MTRRLVIRPEAEAEMAEAFEWYEERLPGLGASFLLCVDAVFHGIVRDPQLWPRIHREARRALTRRFPYEVFFVAGRGTCCRSVCVSRQTESEELAGESLKWRQNMRRIQQTNRTSLAALGGCP
jgi:hypothetical protein